MSEYVRVSQSAGARIRVAKLLALRICRHAIPRRERAAKRRLSGSSGALGGFRCRRWPLCISSHAIPLRSRRTWSAQRLEFIDIDKGPPVAELLVSLESARRHRPVQRHLVETYRLTGLLNRHQPH